MSEQFINDNAIPVYGTDWRNVHKPSDVKSPLRYSGGKSRAIAQILKYIPSDVTRLCSPFIGDGSIELALAAQEIEVYAYDIFKPLIQFWNEVLHHPKRLYKQVQQFYPLTEHSFITCKRTMQHFRLSNKQPRFTR